MDRISLLWQGGMAKYTSIFSNDFLIYYELGSKDFAYELWNVNTDWDLGVKDWLNCTTVRLGSAYKHLTYINNFGK